MVTAYLPKPKFCMPVMRVGSKAGLYEAPDAVDLALELAGLPRLRYSGRGLALAAAYIWEGC